MHKTVTERHVEDSLSPYVSTEVAYNGHVWRTSEAESVAAHKLVQFKAQEEDSTLAVVDKTS
jgi:hypothetical protein